MEADNKTQPLKVRRQDKDFIRKFLSLIPFGRAHAIKPERLARLTDHKSIRSLQKTNEIFRNNMGVCILSAAQPPGGFYQSNDPSEVREFIKTLENRGNKTLRAAESAKAYLRELEQNSIATGYCIYGGYDPAGECVLCDPNCKEKPSAPTDGKSK